MNIEEFKIRRTYEGDEYAIAVPVRGAGVVVIETFPSREQLEAGYTDFYSFAKSKGLTLPVPIKYVDNAQGQRSRSAKILKELLKKE